MTEYLRMTASCVYLRVLRSFSEHLFYRAPLGNCLFHVQVPEFQPLDTVKNYFTSAFQAFHIRATSSHSKTFKILKDTWNSRKLSVKKLICNEFAICQPASLWKNSFTDPHSCILLSFSQNVSRLLLPKRFWKCASTISLSRK